MKKRLILGCAQAVLALSALWAGAAQADCSDPVAVDDLSRESIGEALSSTGLLGRLHGSLEGGVDTVMTVRAPSDFFSSVQVTLVPLSDDVRSALRDVRRHDKVCLIGSLAPFGEDQIHAFVNALRVMENWTSPYPDLPEYEYQSPSLEELPNEGTLAAKVHAVEDGLLVLEVGDRITPVIVRGFTLPENLYRSDRVELDYVITRVPGRPTHLSADLNSDQPLRVTRRAAERHGQEVEITGSLALFPESPQLTLDIFALYTEEDGFLNNHTLVNFENPEVFEEIRNAMNTVWVENSDGVERSRNFFVNRRISLTVRAVLNVQSPSQANPQLLIDDVSDIQVTILPEEN